MVPEYPSEILLVRGKTANAFPITIKDGTITGFVIGAAVSNKMAKIEPPFDEQKNELTEAQKHKMKLHLISASMFAACSMYAPNPIEALEQEVAELRQQLASQQQQLAALRPLAALAPFVSVDLNPGNRSPGPHITFNGVNVHIIAGLPNSPTPIAALGGRPWCICRVRR